MNPANPVRSYKSDAPTSVDLEAKKKRRSFSLPTILTIFTSSPSVSTNTTATGGGGGGGGADGGKSIRKAVSSGNIKQVSEEKFLSPALKPHRISSLTNIKDTLRQRLSSMKKQSSSLNQEIDVTDSSSSTPAEDTNGISKARKKLLLGKGKSLPSTLDMRKINNVTSPTTSSSSNSSQLSAVKTGGGIKPLSSSPTFPTTSVRNKLKARSKVHPSFNQLMTSPPPPPSSVLTSIPTKVEVEEKGGGGEEEEEEEEEEEDLITKKQSPTFMPQLLESPTKSRFLIETITELSLTDFELNLDNYEADEERSELLFKLPPPKPIRPPRSAHTSSNTIADTISTLSSSSLPSPPSSFRKSSHLQFRLKDKKRIRFSEELVFGETYHSNDYDRRGDMVQLTPAIAQAIKAELNEFKSKEMMVHEMSQANTHILD